MLIGIDIDDTLINTREKQLIYWGDYVTKNPREGYSKELPSTINYFDDKYINVFWDTYREHLAFEPSFKDNVSTTLHKLKNKGFNFCIVTARREENCPNIQGKIKEWFKENDIPIEIIYTDVDNKGKFCKKNNIDIFIDDDIKNITNANEYNIKTIMFNNNPNYEGLQTDNWLDLYDILIKLKEEQN